MAKFLKDVQYTFDDVVLVPQYSSISSRKECDTSVVMKDLARGIEFCFRIPICSSNMDTITGYEMAKRMSELGGLGIIHRGNPTADFAISCMQRWKDEDVEGPIALSVGSSSIEREKKRLADILTAAKKLGYDKNNLILCVDLAHGHSKNGTDTLADVRQAFDGFVIAGAVATDEAASCLMQQNKASAVRVGIGSGSACKTRTTTGCGFPQLSAILNTANSGNIIADGGIKGGADAAKALAGGAKMIMIGGLLAGTDYTPNWSEGGMTEFKGMASNRAKNAVGIPSGFEEGVAISVKCKPRGSTNDVVTSLLDGITSAMSYAGTKTLTQFSENAIFAQVSVASHYEGTPHIIDRINSAKN
jgi:IMP dehydrogenase